MRYHLRSIGVKFRKPSFIFLNNIILFLNKNNIGILLNKKTVALSYHLVMESVANDVVEVRKIDTEENYADLFIKAMVSNELHDF